MSLDEYPTRDENKEVQAKAESEFEGAIVDGGCFVVQQRDRNDNGTDFQIEAKELASSGMTNVRAHVQLKGTDKNTNQDNSVSISVERTNLNYLLSQPGSVYVCYHRPTNRLLFRSAESVFQELEHGGTAWRTQKTVTVRFQSTFDSEAQSQINGRIVAYSKTSRDDRLGWITTTPEQFSIRVAKDVPTITVPEAPEEALNVLQSLYEQNKDEVISKAFDQFLVAIGHGPQLLPAYLSEINLAMRRLNFDRDRVANAVNLLEKYGSDDAPDHIYCLGNAHSALGNRGEAQQLFRKAIDLAIDSQFSIVAAQSWKNLGTEIEHDGDLEEAHRCYENAIRIEPNLMEAHMALAHVHREAERWEKSLEHLDQVIWAANDVGPTLSARGRRIELHFLLGNSGRAFEDILSIMTYAEKEDWILPWCARLVFEHARSEDSQIDRTIRFWDAFLQFRPADRFAARERLLCLAYAKMHGLPTGINFVRFTSDVAELQQDLETEDALLWDRAGHWAQIDDDWDEAEIQYRKAYDLEPERYGYCLGTALNSLKRHDEALPILLEQANHHQPDALSWFQVAIAQEGVGDYDGCENSYRRALELDPDYDLALFNLGGVLWNYGSKVEGIRVWQEALRRFPSHPLAEELRRQFSDVFTP